MSEAHYRMTRDSLAEALTRANRACEDIATERDELRAALRDLRAWMMTPGSVEQWAALRVRVDALIGPYGEQGAQSANVSKDVKSIA